jgi:hypothetical protein
MPARHVTRLEVISDPAFSDVLFQYAEEEQDGNSVFRCNAAGLLVDCYTNCEVCDRVPIRRWIYIQTVDSGEYKLCCTDCASSRVGDEIVSRICEQIHAQRREGRRGAARVRRAGADRIRHEVNEAQRRVAMCSIDRWAEEHNNHNIIHFNNGIFKVHLMPDQDARISEYEYRIYTVESGHLKGMRALASRETTGWVNIGMVQSDGYAYFVADEGHRAISGAEALLQGLRMIVAWDQWINPLTFSNSEPGIGMWRVFQTSHCCLLCSNELRSTEVPLGSCGSTHFTWPHADEQLNRIANMRRDTFGDNTSAAIHGDALIVGPDEVRSLLDRGWRVPEVTTRANSPHNPDPVDRDTFHRGGIRDIPDRPAPPRPRRRTNATLPKSEVDGKWVQ